MFAGRRGVAILTLAACVPLLTFAVRVLTTSPAISSISDLALIEQNIRDVGNHSVLTGAYSRFRWNHPGPALFYVLAVPYRAFGSSSAAMFASAALINAGAVAGIVAVAWRHGGRRLALWTLVVISVYLALLSPAALGSPWNPLILLMPFVLLALLGWSLGLGNIAMLPVIAGLGSFIAQSHIGYLGVVGVVTLFGLVLAIARRAGSRSAWMRAGVISALVLAVMWLPPVVEQFSGDGGNLGETASWFANRAPDHSVADAAPITLRELGAIPARIVGATGHVDGHAEGGGRDAPWVFGLLTLVVSAGAAVVAWNARRTDPNAGAALDLIALGFVLAAASLVLLARVVGPLYDFVTIWTSTIGVLLWIGVGAVLVQRSLPRGRMLANVAVALVLVIAFGNTSAALTTNSQTDTLTSSDIPAFADAIEANAEAPVVISVAAHASWPWMTGLLLELEKRGIDAKAVDWEFMVGRRRTADPETVPTILVATPGTATRLLEDPANEQIAANDEVVVIRTTPDGVP